MGGTSNHPCQWWFSMINHPAIGVPPFLETFILVLYSIYGINAVMAPFSSFKIPISGMEKTNWLVLWNIFFSFSWEFHHPN